MHAPPKSTITIAATSAIGHAANTPQIVPLLTLCPPLLPVLLPTLCCWQKY
jgi:hypothetical protein